MKFLNEQLCHQSLPKEKGKKMAQLVTNFTRDEVACKCGCGFNDIDMQFLLKIQAARTLSNVPFRLRAPSGSACRCAEHNISVGGSEDSSHVKGLAMDIPYANSRECYLILDALIRVGFHRIGIGRSFIHVDDDQQKDPMVIWNYY
jgi:zinc D-Ala-D-Ala carboxypeptidase